MFIFPAIDLYEGKAVRLYKGEYGEMTVYSDDPASTARDFVAAGASHIHVVDLEGAKNGGTPNYETVKRIKETSGVFCEIGGGVRSMEVVDRYLTDAGLDRVILGTSAVTDETFVRSCVEKYGDRIAVGVDLKDGFVAVRGWTEKSGFGAEDFCERMQKAGVRTVICTDVSRDGAMAGANAELYRTLSERFDFRLVASGGVSGMDDVRRLAAMGLYGAIIGKAYYTGAIDLAQAVREAE